MSLFADKPVCVRGGGGGAFLETIEYVHDQSLFIVQV